MKPFAIETYFSKWEFNVEYNLAASDADTLCLQALLDLGSDAERDEFMQIGLGYTQTWGTPELRAAIADTYRNINTEQVLCFAGSEEAIYATMRSLLSSKEHAIVAVPNYQSAETVPLHICAVTGVSILSPEGLDVTEVERAIQPNTKLIAVNFPHNPTGKVASLDQLHGLIALCKQHDLYLFNDEVYRLLEHNPADRLPQLADLYEKGISMNGMSKAYGLAGLRLGWIASQDNQVLQKIERYKHYLSICNPGVTEYLARLALKYKEPILSRNQALLASNLELLKDFCQKHRELFNFQQPAGGCIAFLPYKGRLPVEKFCQLMIEQAGVLLLPSTLFHSDLLDVSGQYVRFGLGRASFAEGIEVLSSTLNQLKHSL